MLDFRESRALLTIAFEKQVLPRFELGSLDSESRVLTITPWNLDVCKGGLANIKLFQTLHTCTRMAKGQGSSGI